MSGSGLFNLNFKLFMYYSLYDGIVERLQISHIGYLDFPFFLIEQSCSNILLWDEGLYVTIFYPLDLLFDVFSIEDQGKVSLTS